MEAWTDLYEELATKITDKLTDIQWVDLWHEQVSYLTEELPFPVPAVFLSFNTVGCNDKGLRIQDCDIQVDMYLFYETFSDTYQGSYNKTSALEYLRILTDLHTLFHATSGTNYSEMRRVDMKREESGDAGNLYRISFACNVEDASAEVAYNKQIVNEITMDIGSADINRIQSVDEKPLFIIGQ
jgi:hypothetical protein